MTPLWLKLMLVVVLTWYAFGAYFAIKRGTDFATGMMWNYAWPYLITYCWWHGHSVEFRDISGSVFRARIGRCAICSQVLVQFPRGTDCIPEPFIMSVPEDWDGFRERYGVTIKQALGEEQ